MKNTVRAFGPDGTPRRNYSEETSLHYESLDLVFARRNRQGKIISIHFVGEFKCLRPIELGVRRVRFTRKEFIADRPRIVHQDLPYDAVRAQLGGASETLVERAMRLLHFGVELNELRLAT